MSPYEILASQLESIAIPNTRSIKHDTVGVYFLVRDREIVYVGSSKHVENRIIDHREWTADARGFDSVLVLRVPMAAHPHYEGAFIRLLRPVANWGAPRFRRSDNEIYLGFGLPLYPTTHRQWVAEWRQYMDDKARDRDRQRRGDLRILDQEETDDDEEVHAPSDTHSPNPSQREHNHSTSSAHDTESYT